MWKLTCGSVQEVGPSLSLKHKLEDTRIRYKVMAKVCQQKEATSYLNLACIGPRNLQFCLASMVSVHTIFHLSIGFIHGVSRGMKVILLNIAWQGTKQTTFQKVTKRSSHRLDSHFCCEIVLITIPNCWCDTSVFSCANFVSLLCNTRIFVRLDCTY